MLNHGLQKLIVLNAESWIAKASIPKEDCEIDGESDSCIEFDEGTFDAEII